MTHDISCAVLVRDKDVAALVPAASVTAVADLLGGHEGVRSLSQAPLQVCVSPTCHESCLLYVMSHVSYMS